MNQSNKIIDYLTNKYFNENLGFGKYKEFAIKLLKEVTEILDEFNICYFLISGTLLGFIRHNDFIPWDDDIDLIVDASIIDKLPEIKKKYSQIRFMETPMCKWLYKGFYEKSIIENLNGYEWNWPFVDLFIFGYNDDKTHLNFFNRLWDVNKFFPVQKKQFLGMEVSIPNDPDYFLKINYGSNYMKVAKSNNYCHKSESGIDDIIEMDMKLLRHQNSNNKI